MDSHPHLRSRAQALRLHGLLAHSTALIKTDPPWLK